MKDNDIALIICDPYTAKMLIDEDPEVKGSLVVVSCADYPTAAIVRKEDFLDWIS